ncbi:glycoside hydrolase, partial [Bimuria novae-zelandiae CBS 107.79]
GLPDDTLKTNCISIGFLPSEGDSASPRYTMAQINSKLGAQSSTYGWYAQISSSGFDGSQLLAVKDDVVASGAVFVASVMPGRDINFSAVTADVAKQVASVMKQFTDAGVTVWLRYAHEMNWYIKDGTYNGDAASFVTSWKHVYDAACRDNPLVSCFWSPNQDSTANIEPWWPGDDYVDLVGIDCYPRSKDGTPNSAMFDKLYGGFYDKFSKPYNLPFAIGETGAGSGQKEPWLETLVSADTKAKYPNYVSMSWFEFDKEADFRIVMTDEGTLGKTKEILLKGGDEQCGGSGNGTTPPVETETPVSNAPSTTSTSAAKPTNSSARCDWGCWGWDCSASVPCQEPWSCKGGYCK